MATNIFGPEVESSQIQRWARTKAPPGASAVASAHFHSPRVRQRDEVKTELWTHCGRTSRGSSSSDDDAKGVLRKGPLALRDPFSRLPRLPISGASGRTSSWFCAFFTPLLLSTLGARMLGR